MLSWLRYPYRIVQFTKKTPSYLPQHAGIFHQKIESTLTCATMLHIIFLSYFIVCVEEIKLETDYVEVQTRHLQGSFVVDVHARMPIFVTLFPK